MNTITIAPLATCDSISAAAQNAIRAAKRLFLQSALHPCMKWLDKEGISYTPMDDLFDGAEDFDELNLRIAKRLICGEDCVYAVHGRGVGSAQLEAISTLAKENNAKLVVLPSSGYAEAAMAASANVAQYANAYICAANALPETVNPYIPLIVEEIDTQLRAGEVKLALEEFYPDDCNVEYACMDENGRYSVQTIPLYELDRQKKYFAAGVLMLRGMKFLELSRHGTEGVVNIMRILRGPNGCPWDIKQTHETLKTPLIEEAYEVLDAIVRDDEDALLEELGDLLLQIVFHAQIKAEQSCFDMRDVSTGIVQKLIYRHPHVFGQEHADTADDVLVNWEKLKTVEKHQSTQADVLNAVPRSFPALLRSWKVQKKASGVGFDWDCASDALYKIKEEADELLEAIANNSQTDEEYGDLMFSVVNVARLLKIDPEIALNAATDKFINRFTEMEKLIIADNKNFADLRLEEMDYYWDMVKKGNKQ